MNLILWLYVCTVGAFRPYLSKQSVAYQLTGLLNNNAANPSSQLLVYTVEIILVRTYGTIMILLV